MLAPVSVVASVHVRTTLRTVRKYLLPDGLGLHCINLCIFHPLFLGVQPIFVTLLCFLCVFYFYSFVLAVMYYSPSDIGR